MTVNPRMWAAALRVIPRIEKAEFDRLDPFARWLIATRGAVLMMTFLSATLGGLFAALDGQFDWGLCILVAVGLVLLVFLSLKQASLAIKVFRQPKPAGPPEGYPKESWPLWFVGFAFLLNRNYGSLFMIALLLAVLLQTFTSIPVSLHF